MSQQCDSIRAAMEFLQTEHATEDDVRLVSQVKIWSISGRVFDCFGIDVSKPLTLSQQPQLRRFSLLLDTWYADWSDRFGPNAKVGNYPAKGVGLHLHFAKLYLCSHAFRGVQHAPSRRLTPELGEIASTAMLSASSILGLITNDGEMQSFLNGLPLCFDMMIAFSVVFLLKIATKYPDTVWMDKARLFELTTRTVEMLKSVSMKMHESHMVVCIANGLDKLVQKLQVASPDDVLVSHQPMHLSTAITSHQMGNDLDWIHDMSNFDLFNLPAPSPELHSWPLHLDLDYQIPQ